MSAAEPRTWLAGPAETALRVALRDLSDRGGRTPCGGRDEWTGDDPSDRAYAVAACRFCPILAACGTAADEIVPRWGVWAGRDRTETPGSARVAS